jgi:CubicO group peptidase (beta-lactamase class C family)
MEEDAGELLPCTRRALLHRLAVGQAEGRSPSMVGAVVRDGGPVWEGGRGRVDGRPPDGHVAYRIGSITKTFTAVLVLQLRDEGLLDLNDPVERHLPDTPVGRVTVAQLLAHAGGVGAEPPGPWWERTPGEVRPTLADVLDDPPLRHPPGRRFHYSNVGYATLGAVVERLRGRTWAEALSAEILGPLGMTETGIAPVGARAPGWATHPWADVLLAEPAEDYGPMAPAGQLWSTAADLCRWGAFLAAGDERVLRPESLAEMRRPAVPRESDGDDYGLGLDVLARGGRSLVGHTGSVPGYLAALVVSPDDGVGAVALANATAGPAITDIAVDLVRTVCEREPRLPAAWRPAEAPDRDVLELTGPWYWGPLPMALRLRAARELELSALNGGTGRATRLLPRPDGTWLGVDGYWDGEAMRVVRDGAGTVSHLDIGTFVLTRGPYHPAEPVPGGVDPAGWQGA